MDVYTCDKILELKLLLDTMSEKPSVIALSEVKPKHFRYKRNSVEYNIDGYEIEETNIFGNVGRGLLIYVKNGITYNKVDSVSNFCEYCCLEIVLQGEKIILTLIYRSPNSLERNNHLLLDLFQEMNEMKATYKIITGDFNLPQINWENYTTNTGINDFGTTFMEKVRDCFLMQHVKDVTRMRGEHMGNTGLVLH